MLFTYLQRALCQCRDVLADRTKLHKEYYAFTTLQLIQQHFQIVFALVKSLLARNTTRCECTYNCE